MDAAVAELEQQRAKVSEAVRVLNHDAQSCNRVAANQWLVQFQQSDAAWEVATSLLLSPPPPLSPVAPPPAELLSPSSSSSPASSAFPLQLGFEVEFFAAQILRRKVQLTGLWLLCRTNNSPWTSPPDPRRRPLFCLFIFFAASFAPADPERGLLPAAGSQRCLAQRPSPCSKEI